MKIDIGLLLSLFAVLVNFGTILSYYWKMSERILNAENRISNIENNNLSKDLKSLMTEIAIIKEEYIKISSILGVLKEKINDLKK